MGRGHLLVVLLAVMILTTLATQYLKRLTPLVHQAAQVSPLRQKSQRATNNKTSSPQHSAFLQLQHSLKQFTPQTEQEEAALSTPVNDASLFKDWMDNALQQTQTTPPSLPSTPAHKQKTFLQITPLYPPVITNPHFTPAQLRSARIRLRELRLNNQETLQDVEKHFGIEAKEKAAQLAARAEQKAVQVAQNKKTWKEFERALTQINNQFEKDLNKTLQTFVK